MPLLRPARKEGCPKALARSLPMESLHSQPQTPHSHIFRPIQSHYYIQTNGIFKLSMELYFGSPYVPTPLIHSRSVMALQRGPWPRSPAHFPTIFHFSTIFILIPFSFLYHFHFNTIFILIPFSF